MVCAEPGRALQLVPLHTRSCYSFGFGVTPVEKLVERSLAVGLKSLALTDRDNLCGQILFHKLARDRGLHPVTGVELNFCTEKNPTGRLVLLARDREGYSNLCRIITREKCREKQAGAAPGNMALEAGQCAGLFLMTDSVVVADSLVDSGLDPAAMRLLLVRPDPITPESRLLSAARRLSIPLLADPDIVFLDPGHHLLHRLSAAISKKALLSDTRQAKRLTASKERYFAGPRLWRRIFSDVPDAIEETARVAGQCELDLTRNRRVFPSIQLPGKQDAASYLRKRCLQGIRRRHGEISQQAAGRLDQELQVIVKLGFCEYFIIVADIVAEARRRQISSITRGSGAGSLVAWALDISSVDPLAHRLHFERFLHEEREGDLPDLDIDLCWIRRDEIIRAVYELYGSDRVAMVSAHNTFQPRSALRETLKSFGVSPTEASSYSRSISGTRGGPGSSLAEAIERLPLSLRPPLHKEPFRSAIPLAQQLTGLPRNLSVHCGGIVIADGPIDSYAPLQEAAKGVIITQYDKSSVEKAGLVKIDLLGNRCLSEIDEALAEINRNGCSLKAEEIPQDDPATIKLLREGNTLGCFQLESPAMRSLLRKLRPGSAGDCTTALALVRPAAAAGGAKEAFIRRRRRQEPVPYHHPVLRKILEDNLGTILYEEDVMRIASAAAGVSLVEGELLRRALQKSSCPEDLKEIENHFIAGAVRQDIPPTAARSIWDDLQHFAGYCFSKAHACSYGTLAWQSAWLKANYPVEFSCALLNHHAGMYDKRAIAAEVLRMGIELLGPCVNHSSAAFSIESNRGRRKIRTALRQVRNLGGSSIEKILSGRPYTSLIDFIRRTAIPQREIESLILADAFDGLCEATNHPQLLWELKSSYSRESGRGNPGLLPTSADGIEYPPLEHYPPWKRLCNELEHLGMNIRKHPLSLCRRQLENDCRKRDRILLPAADISPLHSGRKVFIAGLIAASRRIRTSRDSPMMFLTIEDETGLLEGTLFPSICRRFGSRLTGPGPYLFEGVIESEDEVAGLNINGIEPLDGKALAARPGKNCGEE